MAENRTESPKKEPAKKFDSLDRSMDIFMRITNLSMEWNMSVFMGSFVTRSEKEKYWESMHQKMAKSILDNIKSLKGCWVKLGQFLSTKSGMLPQCYLDAFSELQDYMPVSDFGEVIDTIEDELGFMDDIYQSFDSIPIASASIGQVHRAILNDGSVVAVKVQHKSSEQNLVNDIEILKMITNLMNAAGVYPDVKEYFEEYAGYALKELDFEYEASNIKYSHGDVLKSKVPIRVPKLYEDLCSKHVINMEFYDVHKFTDKKFTDHHRVNFHKALYDVHDFAFFQILSCGRLHSDPHPGNLLLTYDHKERKVYPVLLDWGFTTHISDIERIGLSRHYNAVFTLDPVGLISSMIESGFVPKDVFPFRYDLVFNSLINIMFSSFKLTSGMYGSDMKMAREMQAKIQKALHEHLTRFFTKAPTFLPLTFKVISEYQSLSKTLHTHLPFLHLVYKNASYALTALYDSPLNWYYGCLGHATLRNKLRSVVRKMARRGVRRDFDQLLEKLSDDSLDRNKNFRVFSELTFPTSKSLLESRLADLLRHLAQDKSNLIAFQMAVICGGAIDVDLSFGNIDQYETRPISGESLFPLFNISTGLLVVAVLHLASIGRLGLTDRVHIYWPEFRQNKEFVTIRDVLDHGCGVIYAPYPFFDVMCSRDDMMRCVERAEFFSHNEGADYAHIFYGFILSEIITRVTGVPTEEFVLMLASMVGIDSSAFMFPNLLPEFAPVVNPPPAPDDASSSSSSDAGEAPTNPANEFANKLNQLFGQSASAFRDNLPLLNFFNGPKLAEYSAGIGVGKSDPPPKPPKATPEKPAGGGHGSSGQSTPSYNYSDDSSDEKPNKMVRIVSLDEATPESNTRRPALDIDEYRKNLCLESSVINIPRDDNGEIDATYYCYCYKYDKDFPDDELKRCYVPTKHCPPKNRFVKVFRGSSEDSIDPRYARALHNPLAISIDPDYCSPIKKDLMPDAAEYAFPDRIRATLRRTLSKLSIIDPAQSKGNSGETHMDDSEHGGARDSDSSFATNDPYRSPPTTRKTRKSCEIGSMGHLARTRTKSSITQSDLPRPDGFTLSDLVRYKSAFLDPVNANYELFYRHSVPFLNARSNALSLSLFYHSILSGSLISSEILDAVLATDKYDHALLSRVFTGTKPLSPSGAFEPRFSHGFQKFSFADSRDRVYHGFGHSDCSGSVVMCIPALSLSIAVFVSHCTRQYVLLKVLQLILNHYGLKLLGVNFLNQDFYKILSLL